MKRESVISILAGMALAATSALPVWAAPVVPMPSPLKAEMAAKAEPVRHRRGWRGHHHRRHRDRLGAGVAGAIIGGIIANAPRYYAPPPRVYYRQGAPSAHAQWCHARYRSYRAWDNSFQPYHGPRRACVSPYGY